MPTAFFSLVTRHSFCYSIRRSADRGPREEVLRMTIEDFGARVASVWQGLRPSTRNLVERALTTATTATQTAAAANVSRTDAAYDARSEWELSRLLGALDERADEKNGARLSDEQSRDLLRVAETCASVLQRQA